jgi:type IV pilus assembly protein PilV
MRTSVAARGAGGFSLVEVMVALAVIAIGLLGIAKMQALALSSTTVASERSLAALEASSLAASMHANRAYWAAGGLLPAGGITVTGATVNDPTLAGEPDCSAAANQPCSAVQLAGYDLQVWAGSLAALLPNDTATVLCTTVVGVPITCTIQISWAERSVALTQQEANTGQFQNPTYTLYVEP